uniref:Bm1080 n=2 Tax=Brugia TaxID=6278 RepID=A0A1I9G3Z8_BRUMA|nr:Bm1080 [Brugia malayi]
MTDFNLLFHLSLCQVVVDHRTAPFSVFTMSYYSTVHLVVFESCTVANFINSEMNKQQMVCMDEALIMDTSAATGNRYWLRKRKQNIYKIKDTEKKGTSGNNNKKSQKK